MLPLPRHRVSGAHDPLAAHPARQDVHSAQEMTPIDCSLFNREREEAVGENEAICTMGCVRRVLYMRTGTCLNQCKDILELCIRVHFHCFFFSMLNSHGRVFASNCLHEFASNHLFPLTLVCLYSIPLHVGHTIYNMTDLAPFCIYMTHVLLLFSLFPP